MSFRWDGDRSESRDGEAGTGRCNFPEDGWYRATAIWTGEACAKEALFNELR